MIIFTIISIKLIFFLLIAFSWKMTFFATIIAFWALLSMFNYLTKIISMSYIFWDSAISRNMAFFTASEAAFAWSWSVVSSSVISRSMMFILAIFIFWRLTFSVNVSNLLKILFCLYLLDYLSRSTPTSL